MAVCVECISQYSQLKEDIHCLRSELWQKDRLIERLISISASQANRISYLQSSILAGQEAQSPPFLFSQTVSASVATLPWLTSLHAGTGPTCLDEPAVEVCGLSPDRGLHTGEPDTPTIAVATLLDSGSTSMRTNLVEVEVPPTTSTNTLENALRL